MSQSIFNEITQMVNESRPDLRGQLDDLVLDHATLLNDAGRFEEAKFVIDEHIFAQAPEGVNRVTEQYQRCRLEIAKHIINNVDTRDDYSRNELTRAIALLEECLVLPEHIGEYRVKGAQDNDFYYFLGRAFELKGRMMKHANQDYEADRTFSKASKSYRLGVQGYTDITDDTPVNRNKAFFAAQCFEALGDYAKSEEIMRKIGE